MEYQYEFRENDGDLEIVVHRGGEFIRNYPINISELARTTHDGEKMSFWILQLDEKTWFDTDMIYKVAKLITDYHPVNSISWFSTFDFCERRRLYTEVADLLRPVNAVDNLGTIMQEDVSDAVSTYIEVATAGRKIQRLNELVNSKIKVSCMSVGLSLDVF